MVRSAGSSAGVLALIAAAAILALPCGPGAARAGDDRNRAHSADEIARLVRQNGLVPFASPRRQGNVFVVEGVDDQGEPTRVVVDAVTGDLLWRTHRGVEQPGSSPVDGPEPPTRRIDARVARHPAPRPDRSASAAALGEDTDAKRRSPRRVPRVAMHLMPHNVATAVDGGLVPHRSSPTRDPLVRPAATAGRPIEITTRTTDTQAGEPTAGKPRPFVPVAPLE